MRTLITTLLLLLFSLPSWARWKTVDEATFAENFERQNHQIRLDGTYTLKTERQIEILKESARSLGLTRITFSSAAAEFDLQEAYTLNGKEKVGVPAKMVEKKPLASRGQGFDEHTQVTIAYPQIFPGSKIYYRYELKQKKPAIPGLFKDSFSLGRNFHQEFEVNYESEIPLYWEIHDPESVLDVSAENTGDVFRLKFRLKKPIFRSVIEEENSLVDRKSLVWVAVSTAKDWASMPKETPAAYEAVIHSPLPASFAEILHEATKEKTDLDKINAVTSRLAALIRYVGDWAPVEGAFHPRPLDTIATTGFGDCKDFTSATGAILSHLGFEVHGAWVQRAKYPTASPLRTIAAPNFNHAILYARKDDREYWLDPTNLTSFAQGIYPDIAGRPTLLLLHEKPELRDIPPLKPEDSNSELTVDLRITNPVKYSARENLAFLSAPLSPPPGAGYRYLRRV